MEYRTLDLLFRCSREFSHKTIRLKSLSDTECRLCSYVYSHAGCSQDDAALALKADKTTVGKALAALERKQCILRTRDAADRRIKRLALTDIGKEKVADLADVHDRWLARVMHCLSPAEQAQFEAYCERLLAAAENLTKNGGTDR